MIGVMENERFRLDWNILRNNLFISCIGSLHGQK